MSDWQYRQESYVKLSVHKQTIADLKKAEFIKLMLGFGFGFATGIVAFLGVANVW